MAGVGDGDDPGAGVRLSAVHPPDRRRSARDLRERGCRRAGLGLRHGDGHLQRAGADVLSGAAHFGLAGLGCGVQDAPRSDRSHDDAGSGLFRADQGRRHHPAAGQPGAGSERFHRPDHGERGARRGDGDHRLGVSDVEIAASVFAGGHRAALHFLRGPLYLAPHQGSAAQRGKRDGRLYVGAGGDVQRDAHGQDLQSGTDGAHPPDRCHARNQEPVHSPAGGAGADEPVGRYHVGHDLYPDHRRRRLHGARPRFRHGRCGDHRLHDRHGADLRSRAKAYLFLRADAGQPDHSRQPARHVPGAALDHQCARRQGDLRPLGRHRVATMWPSSIPKPSRCSTGWT